MLMNTSKIPSYGVSYRGSYLDSLSNWNRYLILIRSLILSRIKPR